MTTTTTKVSTKVDQKVAPGALTGVSIEFAGNGGVLVYWNHAPEKKKGQDPFGYQPRRPDVFANVEEACHAIAMKAGGDVAKMAALAEKKEEKKS